MSFVFVVLAIIGLMASPLWIPAVYAAAWRNGLTKRSAGDTLALAAIEMLDWQPLAWHPVNGHDIYGLAHPEGFVVNTHFFKFNGVEFRVSDTAQGEIGLALERRRSWLQEQREANALGARKSA